MDSAINIVNQSVHPRLSPESIYLTKRQSECFYLLGRGFSTKKIAQTLGLTPRAIEDHIQKIKIKIGVRYKTELIEMAIGLVLLSGGYPISYAGHHSDAYPYPFFNETL